MRLFLLTIKDISDIHVHTNSDIVFIDPPYNTGLSDKALAYLGEGTLLSTDCIVVVECPMDEKKPEETGVLKQKKRYTYSGVSCVVYTRAGRRENE